jgi:hypothetical protein
VPALSLCLDRCDSVGGCAVATVASAANAVLRITVPILFGEQLQR